MGEYESHKNGYSQLNLFRIICLNMNQYVDLFIVIYDLHRQKRGVPCSDRLEQVGQ